MEKKEARERKALIDLERGYDTTDFPKRIIPNSCHV